MERLTIRMLYNLRSMKDIIQFCMDLSLLARTYYCPKCGKEMKLTPRSCIDEFEWTCRPSGASHHYVRRSIRAGSWFARGHITIPNLLILAHLFVRKAPIELIEHELGVSRTGLSEWILLFRKVCLLDCQAKSVPLGGPNVKIEIGEFKFNIKHKRNAKRVKKNGGWLFVGLERESNKFFLKVVNKLDKEALLQIIKTLVLPGTIIYSSCWEYYDCLKDKEFKVLSDQHSLHFKNLEGKESKNSIEYLWHTIKKSIPVHVGDNFESYVGEYFWRKIYSKSDDLTRTFLETLARFFPPREFDSSAKAPFIPSPQGSLDSSPKGSLDPSPKSPLDSSPKCPLDPSPKSPLDLSPNCVLDPSPKSPLDPSPHGSLDSSPKSPLENNVVEEMVITIYEKVDDMDSTITEEDLNIPIFEKGQMDSNISEEENKLIFSAVDGAQATAQPDTP